MLIALIAACVSADKDGTTPTGDGPSMAFQAPMRLEGLDDEGFAGCGCIGTRCDLRHLGVDLDAGIGTEVYAVGPGEVLHRAGPDQTAGWGEGSYALFVRHTSASGPFVTVYGHIDTALVAGDTVGTERPIGSVADYYETLSNGQIERYPSHLHFGVHPGPEMPSGATGLVVDPYCESGDTLGFIAPLAFLRTTLR